MRRAILVGSMVLLPVAAVGHTHTADAPDGHSVASQPPPLLSGSPLLAGRVDQTPPPQPRKPLPPPPPPDTERPRRRGSMVGYIEEAVIGSKVRIRFDVGWHIDAPDRAEFFYAKCGCYRDIPGDPAFDPDAPGPRPGAANEVDFRQFYVLGEYAVSDRVSAYAELPARWIQPQSFIPGTGGPFPDQGGAGDLRAGVKLALVSQLAHMLTARVQAFVPTGDASKGLGTDHWSVEPALLFYNRLADRVVVESQVGLWHPFEGAAGVPIASDDGFAGDVFFYGIGPSFEIYRTERVRFAPVVELVGWRVINGFQTAAIGDASGTNIVNLKIGARASWQPGSSFYVGYGHALTTESWYDEILRFEYRYSF